MKAEFDIKDPYILDQVRNFLYRWEGEYQRKYRKGLKFITASPAMYSLLMGQNLGHGCSPRKRQKVTFMGLSVRCCLRMKGFTMSVNTRKPLDPAKLTQRKMMRQLQKFRRSIVDEMDKRTIDAINLMMDDSNNAHKAHMIHMPMFALTGDSMKSIICASSVSV